MTQARVPCFFHLDQLLFKPVYEWAFGEKLDHPETTARAENILSALRAEPTRFEVRTPSTQPLDVLRETHSYHLLTLYNTARQLPADQTFYPSVFPRELREMGDPTNIRHAGCYCFDSGTPLNAMTFNAAAWSAACAEHAAHVVASGEHRLAYALSRPPGHHATREYFGGYCYFNNTVIAAQHLKNRGGRVAIIDVDFHHGNGTQNFFYEDPQVLTISIHGDPTEYFPFYCGYANETGEGAGAGFNINIPRPKGLDGAGFLQELERTIIPAVRHFGADCLVIAAGLDAYVKDPIGEFALETKDFYEVGRCLGRLDLPTVAVQEGGYYTPDLGENAAALLKGLRDAITRVGV